ncbi:hypothetical protein L6452_21626 [Arctium lappa]|uniref:Uncharacterized protein n=1 Tax=Arctium lappa TaxID=4217 RepID=A0ACB9AYA0_ARCLA|nr:hypothetical protein L6452_21626 [Arctium lappa]
MGSRDNALAGAPYWALKTSDEDKPYQRTLEIAKRITIPNFIQPETCFVSNRFPSVILLSYYRLTIYLSLIVRSFVNFVDPECINLRYKRVSWFLLDYHLNGSFKGAFATCKIIFCYFL